jgi:transposase
MKFIRAKTINGQSYLYEITSYWDKVTKRHRQKSKYLGKADSKGKLLPRTRVKAEKMILDYGDTYLLNEILVTSKYYNILKECFGNDLDTLATMMMYMIIQGSAAYNCSDWYCGNGIKLLRKASVSSQETSHFFASLGSELKQREFFEKYIKLCEENEGVAIDSTSLPTKIHCSYNLWGKGDKGIDKQFKLLCVVGNKSKTPIYYRYLPGNLSDVSTLKITFSDLNKYGVNVTSALLDAGYYSQENIKDFYKSKIDFLMRLPSGKKIYKNLIKDFASQLENPKNYIRYGKRGLFVKREKVDLFGNDGFSYIVLDPYRKGKELQDIDIDSSENLSEEKVAYQFSKCGIMILVSSHKIEPAEVVNMYYMRQSVEQVFGFYKADLNLLPIRRHSDNTVRGYLFLQFLALILFIEVRNRLNEEFTVEQAMMILQRLKCKVYSDGSFQVQESAGQQNKIFKLCNVVVPKN